MNPSQTKAPKRGADPISLLEVPTDPRRARITAIDEQIAALTKERGELVSSQTVDPQPQPSKIEVQAVKGDVVFEREGNRFTSTGPVAELASLTIDDKAYVIEGAPEIREGDQMDVHEGSIEVIRNGVANVFDLRRAE